MSASKRYDVVPLLSFVGLLCAAWVILLPSTRRIAVMHTRMLFQSPDASLYVLRLLGVKNGAPQGNRERQDARLEAVTRQYPNDAPLQIAAALQTANPVQQLRVLTTRFPDNAALRAHILRLSARTLHPGRAPDAETAALCDADAAQGERLEPDNAYFPMMRAMALTAQQKEDQAIAILLRAANKSGWDDHASEEGPTVIKRVEAAFGPTTVLEQAVIQYAVLFPHLAALRGMERSVIADAQTKENAGQTEAGFQERHAILRLGHLMRTQARTATGAEVGALIAQSCMLNPGGAVGEAVSINLPSKPTLSQRQAVYQDYLQRIGHGEEIEAVRPECMGAAQIESFIENGLARSPLGASGTRSLAAHWSINLALLANALAVLALWLVALVLKQTRRTEGLVPTLALALTFTVFLLFALQAQWLPTLGTLRTVIVNLLPAAPGDASAYAAEKAVSNPASLHITGFLASLLAPIALLLGVAFLGLMRRENSVGCLTRGVARWGGVVASVLLLLYAVTLTMTVREETQARNALARTIQHEGRYLADVQHHS